MEWCGVFMMGLWASGLRSLRPLASTHSVPRLTTPSFSPHINPFRKNSKLKQNILWFGLSFVQISCRKIQSFPFLVDFHSFLPKRARKYHLSRSVSVLCTYILKWSSHHDSWLVYEPDWATIITYHMYCWYMYSIFTHWYLILACSEVKIPGT